MSDRAAYDFVLALSGVDALTPEFMGQLAAAGCDDALPVRRGGRVSLDFTREAGSFADALTSAIRDVESIPGVRVVQVSPGVLAEQPADIG